MCQILDLRIGLPLICEVLGYLVDWYIFLRHSQRPSMYDEVIARVAVVLASLLPKF